MKKIHVEVLVHGSLEKVWECWNEPENIKGWAFASDDWECPHAENDVLVGKKFLIRMSSKDKSSSFDFSGTYTDIKEFSRICYTMDKAPEETEARKCEVVFEDVGNGEVKVTEIFDPENINTPEMQEIGWQSILNNFKKFVERK